MPTLAAIDIIDDLEILFFQYKKTRLKSMTIRVLPGSKKHAIPKQKNPMNLYVNDEYITVVPIIKRIPLANVTWALGHPTASRPIGNSNARSETMICTFFEISLETNIPSTYAYSVFRQIPILIYGSGDVKNIGHSNKNWSTVPG